MACPFCNVESQTLSEEIKSADAVVLAKLVKDAPPSTSRSDDRPRRTRAIRTPARRRSKSSKCCQRSEATWPKRGAEINVVFFGESDRDKTFLITGIGTKRQDRLDDAAAASADRRGICSQAAERCRRRAPTRLAFFQDYLENDDPLLAQDAYDEFARAPYSELHELEAPDESRPDRRSGSPIPRSAPAGGGCISRCSASAAAKPTCRCSKR